jgi:hypothetical protein
LYYERRAREYNALPIEKTKVVTQDGLIRAYISVFLEEPHHTTRSFGDVKASVGKSIFLATDNPEPYYVSALALYQLEYLYRSRTLDAKYKPARYLILMAFRILADPTPISRTNSRDMVKYCNKLIKLLWNANKAEDLFSRAAQVVEQVAGGNFHRDHIRTLAFRDSLQDKCLVIAQGTSKPARKSGRPPGT